MRGACKGEGGQYHLFAPYIRRQQQGDQRLLAVAKYQGRYAEIR